MTEALWTKGELAEWAREIKADWRGAAPIALDGISIDSRTVQKKEAFFAIKGDRFDGHDFIAQAAERGAALIVIDKAHQDLAENVKAPCLIAADVLAALRSLAAAARARLKPSAKVAAITGSVGKTTLKEMLAQICAHFGKTHKNPASFNNHWGVPLSLARMPRDTDYALFEIGMNHAGEITPLAALVRPHLALISKIAAAHMGHFNSLEEIAAAKAEIFSGVEKNGYAVLNENDDFFPFLKKAAAARQLNIVGFSLAEAERLKLRLKVPGRHMLENAAASLAAIGAFAAMNHENAAPAAAKAAAALAEFRAPSGRGARYRLPLPAGGSFTLIDESYNANPASMCAALAVLGQERGHKIAVLGDMLELGAAERAAHEALTEPLQASGAERVFLIGSAMGVLQAKLRQSGIYVSHHAAAADIIPLLQAELKNGSCVMVKSSHSLNTGKIITALREHYQ